FRRVPRSSQIIVVLITFGVAQLFSSLSALALGFKTVTTLPGWIPAAIWRVGGATIYSKDVVTILVAVGLSAGFLIWFRASRTGRALRAVAQNREAAMLAGIDDVKYSSIAWGVGAALAALALLLLLPNRTGNGQGLITTIDL